MRLNPAISLRRRGSNQRGSVLVIVLWVALGLVAITLYFANSMSLELRASDNRACGVAADQAIEAAARYATYVLTTRGTNGAVPDYTTYYREAMSVGNAPAPEGNAHFWFIGRSYDSKITQTQPFFGLVDEGSKLNLNTASTNILEMLPRMTSDLADGIVQWRSTNGSSQTYGMLHPPYQCKSTNFETVDELRLVYGANMDILTGEDVNRNGVLDPDEYEDNRNNLADPGLLEYLTVYTREPNTRSDGSPRINLSSAGGQGISSELVSLLQTNLGTVRANQILVNLGGVATFRSPLQFFMRSKMTSDEFTKIANDITASSGTYIYGRVNVTTASPTVLSCLPGMTTDLAQQLISYRESNPDSATNSIAWLVDALGQNNNSILQQLGAGDFLTVQSYQFTADIAALGPYGRGYRRVKYVFDVSGGTPNIIFRQDLSHLGWALGRDVRQTWLVAKRTQ